MDNLIPLIDPKVEGVDYRNLPAVGYLSAIQIVVVTSSKEKPDMKEAYKQGANSHVVKRLISNSLSMS